jgi:hypothetical protein
MKPANSRLRVLPFTPAVPEAVPAEVAPQPYAPRLTRALVLLLAAASLHVWAVTSPKPQPMPLAAFASRLMLPPPIPTTPALLSRFPAPARSKRRVLVQQMLVRVAPRSEPAVRELFASQPAMPVGTAGLVTVASVPKPSASPDRPAAVVDAVRSTAADTPPRAERTTTHAAVSAAPSMREPDSVVPPPEAKRPVSVATVDNHGTQTEVVLALLHEYSRAFERMDVNATKALYPSIDTRGLRKAFEDLEQQHVRFASCGVSFSPSGADANAWCKGDATFSPKVGSKISLTNSEWTFSLSRDGDAWQIMKASMQKAPMQKASLQKASMQ